MTTITNTSAPVTTYCAFKLEGPDNYLWFDGNAKITAGNGSYSDPLPNAFSVLPVTDCPGSTKTCEASCYVRFIKEHASTIYGYYEHNSVAIRNILNSGPSKEWASIVGQWIETNCQGGFRWHVSGDIFSLDYAQWIAEVCKNSPSVNHWLYTRSFDLLQPLENVENLTVNLSIDQDNEHLVKYNSNLDKFRRCYLSFEGELPEILRDGDIIFPNYELRGSTVKGKEWFAALPPRQKKMVCPVDFHGKSDRNRCGPCHKCLRK
jgi:L-rhamnose mutarotase